MGKALLENCHKEGRALIKACVLITMSMVFMCNVA